VARFDKVIPPGQEGKVTLSVKTKNMSGKFAKSATISSNDPKKPTIKIRLKGEVKQYISVKPSPRLYLTGHEGDIITKTLKIINHQDSPLKLTHIESTIDDKIDYQLKHLAEGKEYELTVKTQKGVDGRSRGKITVTTNNEKKPKIEIRVSINLKDELTISPTTLYFGNINIKSKPDKSPARNNLTKYITVKKEKGDPIKIKKIVPGSDLIHTKIETKEEGKRYIIIVTLDKDKLQEGLINDTLEIHTNYKKRPVVKINLKGKVI
jgi:hypothetical protein